MCPSCPRRQGVSWIGGLGVFALLIAILLLRGGSFFLFFLRHLRRLRHGREASGMDGVVLLCVFFFLFKTTLSIVCSFLPRFFWDRQGG